MRVTALLQSLRQERNRKEQELKKLEQAISVLSRMTGQSDGIRPRGVRRVRRRAWTPAMRRAAAARMRKMWKEGRIKK